MSGTLVRHLTREIAGPTFFVWASFAVVVLMADLFTYSDLIVNRGADPAAVSTLAGLQILPTLGRTLPFATLVGILVGLGRLSADRELLVLETMGVSLVQVAIGCAGFAFAMGLVAMSMSAVLSPASERRLGEHLITMASQTPSLGLQPGITTYLGDWRIEASRIEDGGRRLSKVLVFEPGLGETIFASRGEIQAAPNARARLVLEDGLILMNGAKRASAIRFEALETLLRPPARSGLGDPNGLQSQPLKALYEVASNPERPLARRQASIELHRRLALGFGALPLGLLAASLSLSRGGSSRSKGIVFGVVGIVVYYTLVQLSEGLLRDPDAWVALSVWLPNLLITIAAAIVWHASRRTSDPRQASFSVRIRSEVSSSLARRRLALPRYVGTQFLQLAFACLVVLTLGYAIVDIADNLKWFNKYDASLGEIARFYSARGPVLAARVIPLSLLLGASLTIGVLGSNGELLGMRACGLSVFRSLTPIWLLCLLAVPLDHAISNVFVPKSNVRASHVNRTEIKNRSQAPTDESSRIWYRSRDRIIELDRQDLLRGELRNATLFTLDEQGLPMSRIDASTARRVGREDWLFEMPRRVDYSGQGLARAHSAAELFEIQGYLSADIDTSELTPLQLRKVIQRLDASGLESAAHRTDLQNKLSAPLGCFLLPFIILCFSSTGPPFPRPTVSVLGCIALAVGHAIIIGFATSMGHAGSWPPFVAGWTPTLLFASVALGLGIRVRRGLRA